MNDFRKGSRDNKFRGNGGKSYRNGGSNRNTNQRKKVTKAGTAGNNQVYGLNAAFEVIISGKRSVDEAILSESAKNNPRIKKLTTLLEKHEIPYTWQEKGRLIDLCGSHDNQGVVLLCSPFKYSSIDEVLENDRVILLNNVEDPQNVGAVLRSAEVFGFKGVILPEKGTPEVYPSVVKVSVGATEYLDICHEGGVTSYLAKAKEAGFFIVSLDAKGDKTFADVIDSSPEKILLVLGGENKGVGQFVLNSSDYVLGIEQKGRINSLNASVAAGIAMAFLKK